MIFDSLYSKEYHILEKTSSVKIQFQSYVPPRTLSQIATWRFVDFSRIFPYRYHKIAYRRTQIATRRFSPVLVLAEKRNGASGSSRSTSKVFSFFVYSDANVALRKQSNATLELSCRVSWFCSHFFCDLSVLSRLAWNKQQLYNIS